VTALLLLGGLALLVAGGEALVRGSARIAALAGVSPLVIGLTVVAYGTSTPEAVVSVLAAAGGKADIAVANVVGSNVFNVLFTLGICALISPLAVTSQLFRRDVPIMVAVSLLLLVLGADGRIGAAEAALLLGGLAVYNVWVVRAARGEPALAVEMGEVERRREGKGGWLWSAALVLGGLALLVLGARWLVSGSVALARAVGLSETVIGLTIVAAGTSLPEMATSVLATLRGQREIAVGNVVGSNVYNILAIIGISGLAAPDGLPVAPSIERFDLPVMVAVAAACLPIFFTGRRIARAEGLLFLGYYTAYVLYLVLAAQRHDALPPFSAAMLWFALPLTAAGILASVWYSLRAQRTVGAGGRVP
jgi:cation:H+ antiporter